MALVIVKHDSKERRGVEVDEVGTATPLTPWLERHDLTILTVKDPLIQKTPIRAVRFEINGETHVVPTPCYVITDEKDSQQDAEYGELIDLQ